MILSLYRRGVEYARQCVFFMTMSFVRTLFRMADKVYGIYRCIYLFWIAQLLNRNPILSMAVLEQDSRTFFRVYDVFSWTNLLGLLPLLRRNVMGPTRNMLLRYNLNCFSEKALVECSTFNLRKGQYERVLYPIKTLRWITPLAFEEARVLQSNALYERMKYDMSIASPPERWMGMTLNDTDISQYYNEIYGTFSKTIPALTVRDLARYISAREALHYRYRCAGRRGHYMEIPEKEPVFQVMDAETIDILSFQGEEPIVFQPMDHLPTGHHLH